MSGEKYLLLFNSQGSNVVNNSNLNSVSYDVDWTAFYLPHIKILMYFCFKINSVYWFIKFKKRARIYFRSY